MAESIIQDDKTHCFMCGSSRWIECHHIFGGSNRNKAERLGLKVYLCHYCHNEPPNGVHHNRANKQALQEKGQEIAMEYYNWTVEDFRREFGKNYL